MNYLALLYLLCALYCLGLGFFVFGKNPTLGTSRAFLAQTFFAFIWQIGTYFVLTSPDKNTAYLFAKFTYLGAIFVSCATYHLVVNLLGLVRQKKYVWLSYSLGSIVFLPLLKGQQLISGIYHYEWGFWFKAGPFHPLYLTFFSSVALAAFFNLYSSLHKPEAPLREKKKRRLLFFAYLIAYLSVIDFLPDYGLAVLPLGFLFTNLFLTTICYILKYYDFIEDFDLAKRANSYQA